MQQKIDDTTRKYILFYVSYSWRTNSFDKEIYGFLKHNISVDEVWVYWVKIDFNRKMRPWFCTAKNKLTPEKGIVLAICNNNKLRLT